MFKKINYLLLYFVLTDCGALMLQKKSKGQEVNGLRSEVISNDNSLNNNDNTDKIESNIIRRKRCLDSKTIVNGKKIKCRDEVIFIEDFNQRINGDPVDNDHAAEDNFKLLNSTIWRRDVKIPLSPNYEFCVYHKIGKNLKISGGNLKILPTLLDNEFGDDAVYFGNLQLAECTGNSRECSRLASAFNILPPIISTRLTTKGTFKFQYGKIEIRAKFPKGDWLYPEIWLQGTNTIADSRVIMGLVRGNEDLYVNDYSRENFNSARIEYELQSNLLNDSNYRKSVQSIHSINWNSEFHVYTTTWQENGFVFEIDNVKIAEIKHNEMEENDPFHSEFYLILGLGVGGITVFPDPTRSRYHEKPWKNVGAKAMLRFWQAKDDWLPTWNLDTPNTAALQIDYVKIISV